MRATVCQHNPIIGDIANNNNKIISSIRDAKKEGSDIVVFPEMALCGYPPEDFVLHADFVAQTEKALDAIIAESTGIFVVVGLVRAVENSIKNVANSAAIIADGKLLGYHDKILLPTYDVFDEARYFHPGKTAKTWEWKGKKIGVLICEDIWQHTRSVESVNYQRDPVEELKKQTPDLLISIAASPYHFGKYDKRVFVAKTCAETLNCDHLYCAQVGANDQLIFDGYSMHFSPKGEITAYAAPLVESRFQTTLFTGQQPIQVKRDALQELLDALVVGVRDYFHKQGFKKAMIGLSGGIDSALVCVIGARALGAENIKAVMMPSRYNAKSSKTDAEQLAHNLGIKTEEISIEPFFTTFLKELEPYFDGKKTDVTEENLQARIRGIILMALSNKHGHLVLTTSNKSEVAMGYSTLYGDMAGGLGVISDLLKTQVYALARKINENEEIIPQAIIDKPPSAELRPNQKDSDSLPEYEKLDPVIERYIVDCETAEEIVQKTSSPKELVEEVIRKIHIAEYKRRQGAPGLRVSKKSFLYGHRYPITQKTALFSRPTQ